MRLKSLYSKIGIAIILITAVATQNVIAQGCSDAGFCTIDGVKPTVAFSFQQELSNQFKAGFSFGSADHSIKILSPYIEYDKQFNKIFSVDFKLTSIAQTQSEISTFGLSDIFINSNYAIGSNSKLTLGFKIPLSDGNKLKNGSALPMDHQSSLGTLDLLLGYSFRIKNLQLVAAWQQPLTQNKNQFSAEAYPMESSLSMFQSTNQFKRAGDVLVRVSYPFKAGNKFTITPSLLPIYHLTQDKYTNSSGIENKIAGSEGLTLNLTGYVDYKITEQSMLQFNFGTPMIVREVRPDGLTRSIIMTIEYRFKF